METPGELKVACTSSDDTYLEAVITFDPATGALTGMTTANTSKKSKPVTLTKNGVDFTVDVAAGNKSFRASQLASWGYVTLADVQGMSPAC